MAPPQDDNILRRVRRLETLISALIVSDSFYEDPIRTEMFLEFLEDSEEVFEDNLLFRRLFLFIERAKLGERRTRYPSLASAEDQLTKLSNRLTHLDEEMRILKLETLSRFCAETLGLRKDNLQFIQYIPVRVYISEGDDESVLNIETAITTFCDTFGFEEALDFPSERGSWFKKWIVRSQNALNSEQVRKVLSTANRALQTQVDKQQAQVNKANADAAANLISAISSVPNGVVQVGNLFVVKTTSPDGKPKIVVKTLTQEQMEYVENNPRVVKNVLCFLEKLDELS